MVQRLGVGSGVVALVAAIVLALLPRHHEGVTGNAVQPTYTYIGWFAYSRLPEHPTMRELRAAGVRMAPAEGSRDAASDRRRLVEILGVTGLVLIAAGQAFRRRSE